MKILGTLLLLSASVLMAQTVTYEVSITNITRSQIFSPPVVIAHHRNWHLFELGAPATGALATMAEDGDAEPLRDDALAHELVDSAVIGEEMVMPGETLTIQIEAHPYTDSLSVAAMLVTTNDAFFAVDGARAPFARFKQGGAYERVFADAYDAGSEENTENCEHIPGPPCMNMGVRVTENAEGYVYVHSGIHGNGDVSSEYDWRSSVALVEIRLIR